ncbi:MAG: LLM class flavin-dependent oxidoreductase, partial [Candidatus Limnocylindrales bacterium]
MAASIPIGVNLSSIGVSSSWWRETAQLLESAGFGTIWCWDHFISRGHLDDPVLECWMTLAAAAAATERVHVGSFVSNVMNRHPALLARMAATLQEQSGGRVEMGIGIGGHPVEHEAYGIDFPEPKERVERLEESVEILRLLWTGGPVDFEGRYYSLKGAHAFPVPQPAPRILIGGEKPGGARLAARIGD